MNDTGRKKSKTTGKRAARAAGQSDSSLREGYESIRVPKPPASAFNKDRPAGCLLQAQLRHFHHAESARLPKEKRDGRHPEEIRTEAEAAGQAGSAQIDTAVSVAPIGDDRFLLRADTHAPLCDLLARTPRPAGRGLRVEVDPVSP